MYIREKQGQGASNNTARENMVKVPQTILQEKRRKGVNTQDMYVHKRGTS